MSGILDAADLADNLASATKGLAVALGLANPEPKFIEFKSQGISADFQREHWFKTPSQGLYSFSVEEVGAKQSILDEFPSFVSDIASLFDTEGGFFNDDHFSEFKLPITPQEIVQTEDFAVSVKPTQGGSVVNHSGNKFKSLTISGTTGVQPNRGLLGVFKGTGTAVGKPDDIKYRSGYEVFQHFRQWMRSYHERKASPGYTKYRMLFRNYKDWEFLYVEPLKFTMKRDASKPLLYNYSIQFRVIGVRTLEKPLFEMLVSKIEAISTALVNAAVLIKKNKPVSEWYTGTLDGFEQSVTSLSLALKAANKEDLKLADFSKADVEKLSFKEVLQSLSVIGDAFTGIGVNPKKGEKSGVTVNNNNPEGKGFGLASIGSNPSFTTPSAAKAELISALESEPSLMASIPLSKLPASAQASVAAKQQEATLISPLKVEQLQTKTIDLSNKLAEGLGLGDPTYNQIFGLTPTTVSTQTEVTDDQFEMLYAFSLVETHLDGILSSDALFDTNAQLNSKADAFNGAQTVGAGIFSFPNPNSPTKEGFLPAGLTLEQIALIELGDASRWTEIAELNGLKAPYIADHADLLKPNYEVESVNFTDPSQIKNLQLTQFYQIPLSPAPSGAWAGKGNQLAQYLGGNLSAPENWRFIYPDEGMLIKGNSTAQYFKFGNSEWGEIFPEDVDTDGLIKPGDKIKIPSGARLAPTVTPIQGPRDNSYTNSLSPGERSLGVDLKLTESMDLDLTPAGDLNVSYGIANGAQAIVLKLLYEKGSVKDFPSIGTHLTPGKKVPSIAGLRTDITSSLFIDTRIRDVRKINLLQQNNATSVSFEVHFNDIQQPVPIIIPV